MSVQQRLELMLQCLCPIHEYVVLQTRVFVTEQSKHVNNDHIKFTTPLPISLIFFNVRKSAKQEFISKYIVSSPQQIQNQQKCTISAFTVLYRSKRSTAVLLHAYILLVVVNLNCKACMACFAVSLITIFIKRDVLCFVFTAGTKRISPLGQ